MITNIQLAMVLANLIACVVLFLACNIDGIYIFPPLYPNSGSGSDEDNIPCCNCGNDDFSSIIVDGVTSNTIINISTDVVLSTCVMVEGVDNITIIGRGTPTMNCNGIGSVKFVSCNNVTIEGVNWERCGSVIITLE